MARDPRKCTSAKALLEDGCSHAGFVVKEGGRFRSMRTRYFVLRKGCLYYFKDFKSAKEQGAFCILDYSVEEDNECIGIFAMKLKCPGRRSFYFVVSTIEERETWISKLNQEINQILNFSESVCDVSSEPYDYAYQKPLPAREEQNNYEKTDCIEVPEPRNNNRYKLPKSPCSPPPAVPVREGPSGQSHGRPSPLGTTNRLPSLDIHKEFGISPQRTAPSNKYGPHPITRPATKPKPAIPKKPSVSVSKKPILIMEPGVVKKANYFKLQQTLKQRGRRPESYEVQELKNKHEDDDDADSSDSEGYLDLEGEGELDFIKNRSTVSRNAPIGSSFREEKSSELYEKPVYVDADESEDTLLPLSVYQDSLSRASAEDILKGVGKSGMYLIRNGRTGLQVLTVFVEGECKHYQIFENNGEKYLQENEPRFQKLIALVRHYFAHNLPTCSHRLVLPYG